MTTALIVIDVQTGLFTPPPAQAEHVLAAINQLIARAREEHVPVIFVQHETADDELPYGTPAWSLVETLPALPTDPVVRKTTPNSFLRTGLAALLAGLGVEHLIVCGYATEFCVDTTIRQAAALGYAITLAADAHTTHDKPHASGEWIRRHHNATLSSLDSFGVPIAARPTEAIVSAGLAHG
ncbi:cysteine hydrolase family protein [Ralstonia sp. ASV6]|uniref:cysteine hydrolase family protein n=1 Tax=Ralstonia sp. ASV6 TaxID=2795124 RepID=UPI0018ED049C|nr:cysteine hydrolase family protein [Ralstonia sp. ASV6]